MIRLPEMETPAGAPTAGLLLFLRNSLKRQWRDYRKDFGRCRRKFTEKSVHQFRVESRRLLSTLGVLAAVTPGKPLKAATRAVKKRLRIFARLRDTHVQLLAVEQLERGFPGLKTFRRKLVGREKRLTKQVARKLKRTGLHEVARPMKKIRKELRSMVRSHEWDQRSVQAVADALEETFNTVTKRLRSINPGNPVTIHRTRVAFKKFRYMTEALHPLLPGVSERQIERMQEHQGRMGLIQDLAVLRASLEKFLSKHQSERKEAALIRAELSRRRSALMASYLKVANDLFDFAPPSLRRANAASERISKQRPAC